MFKKSLSHSFQLAFFLTNPTEELMSRWAESPQKHLNFHTIPLQLKLLTKKFANGFCLAAQLQNWNTIVCFYVDLLLSENHVFRFG